MRLSNNNRIGRSLAMKWMQNNFEEISESLGSSSFASWIIDGFAKNSHGQNDIDLIYHLLLLIRMKFTLSESRSTFALATSLINYFSPFFRLQFLFLL